MTSLSGIVHDLPDHEYHAHPALSSSGVRERFGFALVNYVPWSPLLIVAGILAIVVVPLTVVGMVVLAVTS